MNIKFGFLLHLTCFLIVCSCRGFYLFAIFRRLFNSRKGSSNLPQQDASVLTTPPPTLLIVRNCGFPSVGHLYLFEANLKNTTQPHPHFPGCHLAHGWQARESSSESHLSHSGSAKEKALGTWRQRVESRQGKNLAPLL